MAVELLDRALELVPADLDAKGLRAERARDLVWAARIPEGAAAAQALLDEGVPDELAVEIHSVLALALLLQGRLAESVEQVEAVIRSPGLSPPQRWHLVAEAALGRLLSGDRVTAVQEASDALEAARAEGFDLTSSLALSTLAWARHDQGQLADALQLATDAVEHAERAGPAVVGRYACHYFLGTVLISQDRYEDARDVFVAGRAAAEAAGAVTILPVHHVGVALAAYAAGQWDDAVADLEAGIALGEELGTMLGMTWHWSVWAQIALHRGERERAAEMLDRAEAEMLRVGPQFGVDWMMWTRALVVEADDPELALAILRNCWDLYLVLGVVQTAQTIGPDLARLAVLGGDMDRATATAARVAEVADLLGTTSARVAALRCRAHIDGTADAAFAAVEAARRGVRPLDIAVTCEEAALTLLALGRRAEAAPLMEEALARFERLGATAEVTRVASALPSVGSRRRPRAAPRPTHGWASLTRSERAVVELVAKGLTNRQIALQLSVSRRTVETHLSHVFGKLGLTSRVELATAATRNS
jgi:DNA-binding CsgD family transcriptional regulator/tetratricopeptide (TPR) repeat protein